MRIDFTHPAKPALVAVIRIDLSRNYNGGGENTGFNGFSPPLNSRFWDRSNDELTLFVREWTCPYCGVNHDRDINAAINLDIYRYVWVGLR